MPRLVALHLMRIRGDWELVFPWPIADRSFYRQWGKIQAAAGIEKADRIRLRDLKAGSLTAYADAGASPHAIMKMGDHSSIATSMHYVKPTREVRRLADELPVPPAFWEGVDPERPRAVS